jgi:hypothetical protein
MGTSRKCKLIVTFVTDKGYWTPAEWVSGKRFNYPGYGKPTAENLAKYVAVSEAATHKGGCNERVGATTILKAEIVRQSTGEILASYSAPNGSL